MAIKALIWDIGGVLVRTEDRGPRAALADELGVTWDELESLVFGGEQGTKAQVGEITEAELWTFVRKALKLTADAYPDSVLRDRFFGGDVLDTALVDQIRAWKAEYKIGIISNAWSELPALLDRWGIADAFEVVVGSGDEGVMKPDPRIYRMALERLGVAADEAVFIDDFARNIQGAREVGMHGVHFQGREQALDGLRGLLNP